MMNEYGQMYTSTLFVKICGMEEVRHEVVKCVD